VAFSSLIARNKVEFMSDVMPNDENVDEDDAADATKVKLPFIVVNTSKETTIDCWLSSDR